MKKNKINNQTELRAEIVRLKTQRKELENYFSNQYEMVEYKLAAPARIFRAATSWLPSGLSKIGLNSNDPKQAEDWLTKTMRIGVPFVLNKFVFRKAGFIKKMAVALLSQTAIGAVNKENMAGIVNKITAFIKPKGSKGHIAKGQKKEKEVDYGIPPYSETY